jgi:nitroreductase/NAD-dependent dihydropyrimidine dehydrogenase PreA subunit
MALELIRIDSATCTQCGACTDVCPTSCLTLENGVPTVGGKNPCIACGHCVAVCPTAALDHRNAPLASQTPLPEKTPWDSATAEVFLRSRRSVRSYRPEPVSREEVRRLLEVARQAPSGGNSQGLSYLVLDDPATLKAVTTATVDWMEELIAQGHPRSGYYSTSVRNYRTEGKDVILRGAPCLVLALAPESLQARGRDNARFSLEYAELYAPTLGLGSCWSGFVELCANSGYRPLLDVLALPEGMSVVGGLMLGLPKHRYRRLPDRQPLKIAWH